MHAPTQTLDRLRTENLALQQAITEMKRSDEMRAMQQQRLTQDLEASLREKEELVQRHRSHADAVQQELQGSACLLVDLSACLPACLPV